MRLRTVITTLALAAILLLPGCSHLSVRHLKRQPWSLETVQSLEMKFWRFEYTATPRPDRFVIRGQAYPTEALPPWAGWIQDLWLEAYLADTSGEVIAKDLRLYQPRELDRDKGLYFEFTLRPDKLGDPGQLFVTFGYRMKLSESRPGAEADVQSGTEPGAQAGTDQARTPKQRMFFASEGALTRL